MMSKHSILIFNFLLILMLCSCSSSTNVLKYTMLEQIDKTNADYAMNTTVECLKNGDKETFKKLFSESIVMANPNLDDKIDKIFNLVQGNIVSSEKGKNFRKRTRIKDTIISTTDFEGKIVTDVDTYRLHFKCKISVDVRKAEPVKGKNGVYLFEIYSETAAKSSGKTNLFNDIEGVYVINP